MSNTQKKLAIRNLFIQNCKDKISNELTQEITKESLSPEINSGNPQLDQYFNMDFMLEPYNQYLYHMMGESSQRLSPVHLNILSMSKNNLSEAKEAVDNKTSELSSMARDLVLIRYHIENQSVKTN